MGPGRLARAALAWGGPFAHPVMARIDVATAQRATSAAVVAPALFVFGDTIVKSTPFALFSALAALVMLLFVTHAGGFRERLAGHIGLLVATSALLCLGTAAARPVALAVAATAVVSFAVLFSGTVSSQLARWSTAMVISFGLPATFPGGVAAIPERLAGWLTAGALCTLAVAANGRSARHSLSAQAGTACRALAERIRAEVRCSIAEPREGFEIAREAATERAADALACLRSTFFATPYWPAALGTAGRHLLQVIEHLRWLDHMLDRMRQGSGSRAIVPVLCSVQSAVADLLTTAGDSLLAASAGAGAAAQQRRDLDRCTGRLNAAVLDLELAVARSWTGPPTLPTHRTDRAAAGLANAGELFIAHAAPTFGTQQLSVAAAAVAQGAAALVDDRRRSWLQRLIGLAPRTLAGSEDVTTPDRPGVVTAAPPSATDSRRPDVQRDRRAQPEGRDHGAPPGRSERSVRLRSHLTTRSVWFQNSTRGAVALAASVLVADLSGVSHQFWVVFGTLAVLRSNAAGTGLSAMQAITGTGVGIAMAGVFLWALPVGPTVLWLALPLVVVVVGLTPPASLAASQAAFTLMLLVLFALVEPTGVDIGLLRLGDVALGGAVSLLVAVALWPRGAGGALRGAAGASLVASATYLQGVLTHLFSTVPPTPAYTQPERLPAQLPAQRHHPMASTSRPKAPAASNEARERHDPAATARDTSFQRAAAIAAGYRFDDAFRAYRSESRRRKVPLSDVTHLVNAAAYLTLTADAIARLWSSPPEPRHLAEANGPWRRRQPESCSPRC